MCFLKDSVLCIKDNTRRQCGKITGNSQGSQVKAFKNKAYKINSVLQGD